MNIFIVIPLYNEEKHIQKVISDISKFNLRMIVVDDGSSDSSGIKVKRERSKNKLVTLLEHRINLGKGAAMKTGAEYAFTNGADAVIFMDSDGQHKASDLPKFIDALSVKKKDIVIGLRNFGYNVPLVRYMGNKFASLLISFLFKVYVSDVICGFRGLSKKGYEKIKWDTMGYGVETEMIVRMAKAGIKHFEVPVETVYHDKVKGVTLLDAFGILGEVVIWRIRI